MVLRLSWLLLWSLQSTPELSAFTTSGRWTFQRPSSLAFTSTLVEMPLFSSTTTSTSTTSLFAKKAKLNSKFLEALETLDGAVAVDEPLSLKEQQELEKQLKREAKKQQTTTTTIVETPAGGGKAKDAKAAALAALEALATEDDSSDAKALSKKEQLALLKHKQNGMNGSTAAAANGSATKPGDVVEVAEEKEDVQVAKQLSKKEQALQRALALEEQDNAASSTAAASSDDQGTAKLSKKELKALQKQEEKLAAKAAEKAAKKATRAAEMAASEKDDTELEGDAESEDDDDDDDDDYEGASLDGEDSESLWSEDTIDYEKEDSARRENRVTLEDKIRKDRPPPRIRVMESSQPGYTSLRLENVGITFRDQAVLKDVTWGVQTGDRIGLVGANGAGKTTQLRIMANEMEPTTGDVVKSSKDLRVAMLRQEFVDELIPEQTLKEEFMTVFAEENKILTDLREAERALEGMTGDATDAEEMQAILDLMQELQNKAEDKGVYALESQVKKVMDLMGFQDEEGDDLVASFSGGWKMRIGLGKVLLKDPNVLLLDEPTNHLDLESVEWLEAFLRQQSIPLVIVSHDREFLDQVCTKIVDAEGGICSEYDGNYSRFLQLKKAKMDSWQASYDAQEKKMKAERQWISEFKVKQPQAVKQRKAKLEKFMESEEYVPKPPFVGKPFKFRFPDAPRLSPEVANIKGLSHSYTNEISTNRLFDEVELFVEKGDRIAVLGPNGSGKSTLLRLLVGREEPDTGSAKIIGANIVMNYFEQNQADALDLDKTVLETIQGSSNGQSYNELRALLGQFLFKGDAVEKKVVNLSGGEKARLSLCCMMLRPANLLILDEPTNHLDIPAKEMLEEALQHFQGSIIVVSHDRFFISRVATTIAAIEDRKLTKYQGDYKFYMDRTSNIKEKVEARYVNGVGRIESAPTIDLDELTKPKRNFGGAKTAGLVTRKNKGIKNAKRAEVS